MQLKKIGMDILSWLDSKLTREALTLYGTILFVIAVFFAMGKMLAPVFAAIIIAYMLDGLVNKLKRRGLSHRWSVFIIYTITLSLFLVALLGLLPLVWQQARHLVTELPNTLTRGQTLLLQLPERYPEYISLEQLKQLLVEYKINFVSFGQKILSYSLTTIPSFITLLVYAVLVPLLVYFFMVDKRRILDWAANYLPPHRDWLSRVWYEVHDQIGNYIRGRIIEIMIVGVACYLVFSILNLHYAVLLSVLVGVSTIVPYVGAVIVTIPLYIVAILQWGWSADLAYLTAAYAVILTLDGNVLVPLLFSEVVSIHPIAIIVSVLVFGGLWGFWGVFFAIPLAILVKAVLKVLE